MVTDARLQTTRAEGTTDIDIKSGFKEERAEVADFDRFFDSRGENQRIGAGIRLHTNGNRFRRGIRDLHKAWRYLW